MAESSRPRPWAIHFFQREPVDGLPGRVPAADYLDGLSVATAVEVHAVLAAVAEAPPPSFGGGGKWEVMHGDMAGIYEARVRGGGRNHRLFCLLVRDPGGQGGTVVCLGGLSKPRRRSAPERDYRRIRGYRDEFLKTGRAVDAGSPPSR